MRIRMVGSYHIYDLMDALDCVVQTLKCNGVDEVRAISIYLSPFKENCLLEFADSDTGAAFDILEYNGRKTRAYRSISPRLTPVSEKADGTDYSTVADIVGRGSPRSNRLKR